MIVKVVIEMCEDGDLIIINGGSLIFMMFEFFVDRCMNVLINFFVFVYELLENS